MGVVHGKSTVHGKGSVHGKGAFGVLRGCSGHGLGAAEELEGGVRASNMQDQ